MLTVSKQPFSLVRQVLEAAPLTVDADQQAVVTHRGSPIVVQGGPGTGKTTVLVEAALARIADGQNPDSILLLTYGRERASELRDAIALRTTKTMFEPLARTFHSLHSQS
jgi:superfamily I DNA/RNA helicase